MNDRYAPLVLRRDAGLARTNVHAVPLAALMPQIFTLYREHWNLPIEAGRLETEFSSFINRGGELHVVAVDGRVVGLATVLLSNSMLTNAFPVERFLLTDGLTVDVAREVSAALIQSIKDDALQQLDHPDRPNGDLVTIRVEIVDGMIHPELLPAVHRALSEAEFRGGPGPRGTSWFWCQIKAPPETTERAA